MIYFSICKLSGITAKDQPQQNYKIKHTHIHTHRNKPLVTLNNQKNFFSTSFIKLFPIPSKWRAPQDMVKVVEVSPAQCCSENHWYSLHEDLWRHKVFCPFRIKSPVHVTMNLSFETLRVLILYIMEFGNEPIVQFCSEFRFILCTPTDALKCTQVAGCWWHILKWQF